MRSSRNESIMVGQPELGWVMLGGTRVIAHQGIRLGVPSPLAHWIAALYSGNTLDLLVLCCLFFPVCL